MSTRLIDNPPITADEAFTLLRGSGQPWLFVNLAVVIAASPEMVSDLIRWTAYGEIPPSPLPPRPPVREWVAIYRRHRTMQDSLAAGMGLPAELPASGMLDDLRAMSHMSRDEIAADMAELTTDELQDFLRLFVGVPFPPNNPTLRAMLDQLDNDTDPDSSDGNELIDVLLGTPAGQYFVRVWWPCVVLYREYPPRLLRAARLGDLDALERLLRLDKYAVGDPGVARVVGDVMSSGPSNDKKRIHNALDGYPTVKLTEANIRAGLAALISQLALLFRSKVTAPQIQSLFDGIERVRSGVPADPKIASTGESWSKAVRRGRTWPGLPSGSPGQ